MKKRKKLFLCGILAVFVLVVVILCSVFQAEEVKEEVVEEEEVIEIPFSDSALSVLDNELSRYLQKAGFNGAMAILYKGVPLYKHTEGRYNLLKSCDSVTCSTTFQLASVSKPITSMAVMMLWERQLIDIEDNVTKYIPEFPYDNITIHQLLNHTSGLQDYTKLVETRWDTSKVITNEDLLQLIIQRNLPLNFKPGERYSYSNTGYTMLALLVERVTKTPYHQWVRENIFLPAGMNTAWIWNKDAADTVKNCAIGYLSRSRKARYYPHVSCDEIVGDKSSFCSLDDMISWDKAIRKRLFVSDSMMQLAWSPTQLKKKEVLYGFGWRMKDYGKRHAVYHNGKWNGFTATYTRFNEEEMTILLLSNTRARAATLTNKIQEKMFSILFADFDTQSTDSEG